MSTPHTGSWLARIGLACVLSTFVLASMGDSGQRVTVAGYDIYYGIVPTQIATQHPPAHEEQTMHGGVPSGRNAYHLLVALFDPAGARVTQAQIKATVTELGLAGTSKALEPMRIGDTLSYGGYFILSGDGPFRIELAARMPGRTAPLETAFEFKRR